MIEVCLRCIQSKELTLCVVHKLLLWVCIRIWHLNETEFANIFTFMVRSFGFGIQMQMHLWKMWRVVIICLKQNQFVRLYRPIGMQCHHFKTKLSMNLSNESGVISQF